MQLTTYEAYAPRMAAFEATGTPSGAATYTELLELVKYRRSVRAIDPRRPVPDHMITQVLELARWAPSAGNVQPWEFLVIRDQVAREWVFELYAKQIEAKREMQQAVCGNSRHVGYNAFKRAPVLIIILCDPRVSAGFPVRTQLDKGHDHIVSSMANVTLLLHHAIASLGLGSQWVSDAASPYMATLLKAHFGIPRHIQVYDMTGVGYPRRMPEAPRRRPLVEMVHHDRYDQGLQRDQTDVDAFLSGYSRSGWAEADAHDR